MSSEVNTFKYKELRECIELVIDHRGKTPRKLGSDWVDHGIPTISAKNVNSGELISQDAIRYVTPEIYSKWMKEDVRRGDCFLVSEGATLGECLYWDNDYPIVLGQRIFCIRTNPGVLYPRYFYAYMTSSAFQSEIIGRATGSSVPGLRQTEFLKLKVKLPSMEQQIFIGDMLYGINKKIQLNRQTNQTLEQIAQAIFESWFVDFEPVKAKALVRASVAAGKLPGTDQPLPDNFDIETAIERAAMSAISGKSLEALEQLDLETQQQLKTTAALFPDALVDSELGEVPEGWEFKLNGDVMDVRDGTHDSPKQSGTGYPLVTSKHITSGVLMIKDAYLISEDDYAKVNKRSQVNQGDILLTMIGTVGIPYLVMQPVVDFAIKNVALFRTSEVKEFKNYFYLLLKSPEMKEYLNARMAGTTQKYLSLKTLRSIDMLEPVNELLDEFNNIVTPLMDKIFSALEENVNLSEQRNTLLPKLLSGELTLNSATIKNKAAQESCNA